MEKYSWVLLSVFSSSTCTDCSRSVLRAQRRVEVSELAFLQRLAGSASPPGFTSSYSLIANRARRGNLRVCTGGKEVVLLLGSLSEGLFCSGLMLRLSGLDCKL